MAKPELNEFWNELQDVLNNCQTGERISLSDPNWSISTPPGNPFKASSFVTDVKNTFEIDDCKNSI